MKIVHFIVFLLLLRLCYGIVSDSNPTGSLSSVCERYHSVYTVHAIAKPALIQSYSVTVISLPLNKDRYIPYYCYYYYTIIGMLKSIGTRYGQIYRDNNWFVLSSHGHGGSFSNLNHFNTSKCPPLAA